jgi:hypothetical protein
VTSRLGPGAMGLYDFCEENFARIGERTDGRPAALNLWPRMISAALIEPREDASFTQFIALSPAFTSRYPQSCSR